MKLFQGIFHPVMRAIVAVPLLLNISASASGELPAENRTVTSPPSASEEKGPSTISPPSASASAAVSFTMEEFYAIPRAPGKMRVVNVGPHQEARTLLDQYRQWPRDKKEGAKQLIPLPPLPAETRQVIDSVIARGKPDDKEVDSITKELKKLPKEQWAAIERELRNHADKLAKDKKTYDCCSQCDLWHSIAQRIALDL